VLDLGSGAGFPGVPLAVLQPQWSVTLVESVQKKAVFLREATRHLSNISVLAQRMEDMGVNVLAKGMEDVGVNALAQGVEDVDARADWVVARAVDPQEVIASVPRLAPNIGLMIGDEDVSRVTAESRIAWQAPVRLPWGDRRLCIFGRCSTWNVEH
jgi:16S rRNA G527 N7-methylase RsmG